MDERYKNLTLLHSNDMHGDFQVEEIEKQLVGGVSMLSGYVRKVRKEEENVVYCIAGDMVQGSIIDTEFRGISTIDIMNLLKPDVVGLGNHEVDYGLTHLLFLERCATFPIVNANIFIKQPFTRLFQPYVLLHIGGIKIMFIGIVTEEILSGIRSDNLISNIIDVKDAAEEVGHICDTFRNVDVDLTVLLTHIGFEEDKKLAALLDPDWGVDIIIGGHSHTVLEKPELVNDILVATAAVGTDQIGRFDIVVDMDTNTVASYKWQLIPVTPENCPVDHVLEEILTSYKTKTDDKFGRIICTFPRRLSHPDRYRETELGNFFTDVFDAVFDVDLVMLGSGTVRKEEAGPVISLGDLKELYPYAGKFIMITVTGEQLKKILRFVLREEAFEGDHTEFFQYSGGFRCAWSREKQDFIKLELNGSVVEDTKTYRIAIQEFHYNNIETSLGIAASEVQKNEKETVLATSEYDVLIEYLPCYEIKKCGVFGRLIVENG
jgi:5'-nucleotidase